MIRGVRPLVVVGNTPRRTRFAERCMIALKDFMQRLFIKRVLGSNGTENTLKDSGGVLCRLGRVAEFRRPYAGTYQGATRRGQR